MNNITYFFDTNFLIEYLFNIEPEHQKSKEIINSAISIDLKWSKKVKKEFYYIYSLRIDFYELIISKLLRSIKKSDRNLYNSIEVYYLFKNMNLKYKNKCLSDISLQLIVNGIWKYLNLHSIQTIEKDDLRKELLKLFKIVRSDINFQKIKLLTRLKLVEDCDYDKYLNIINKLNKLGAHFPDIYIAIDAHNHVKLHDKIKLIFYTFDKDFRNAIDNCDCLCFDVYLD